MLTFIKFQAASILGSLADYGITILLAEVFKCWYLFANGAGNIVGVILQFILLRNWIFRNNKGSTQAQILKFILVFAGNLILSAMGIYFFTHSLHINYIISKTITSVVLGATYNFYMQKKFVFNQ